MKRVKAIAMYLPQFHYVKENEQWWGPGYTDWTAVKNAENLVENQTQPRVPLNKNYYDLLSKETMEWQAGLAKKYNVYGFCFYHYWFKNSTKILEKPAENLLQWKDLDMPFCFCWANESWIPSWSKIKNANPWASKFENGQMDRSNCEILMEQDYGREKEWKQHFDYLLPFFRDDRYIKIDNKPVFVFYKSELVDCLDEMLSYWRKLAKEAGLSGLFIMGANCEQNNWKEVDARLIHEPTYTMGFDKVCRSNIVRVEELITISYDLIWKTILERKFEENDNVYLGSVTDYDTTPRHGMRGKILPVSSPEKFQKYFTKLVLKSKNMNKEYVFINAWNEWGESMYLEPDELNGYAYLEAVREGIKKGNSFFYEHEEKRKERKAEKEKRRAAKEASDLEHKQELEEKEARIRELEALVRQKENRVNKFVGYFNILNAWLTFKERKISCADYFLKHNYHNIAIYGVGELGRHLFDDLKGSSIKIVYGIDKNHKEQYNNIPIYKEYQKSLKIDAIVVTPTFDYANINKKLKEEFHGSIISLEDIINEMKNN